MNGYILYYTLGMANVSIEVCGFAGGQVRREGVEKADTVVQTKWKRKEVSMWREGGSNERTKCLTKGSERKHLKCWKWKWSHLHRLLAAESFIELYPYGLHWCWLHWLCVDYVFISMHYLLEVLDSNNAFIIAALQGEAGHNIGQFGNFRRSRHGDHTLEIATAPRTQNQQLQQYSRQQRSGCTRAAFILLPQALHPYTLSHYT